MRKECSPEQKKCRNERRRALRAEKRAQGINPNNPKEKQREYSQRWRDRHREKKILDSRAYRAANPEKCRAQHQAWNAKNPGRMTALVSVWRSKNPERAKAAADRYRATEGYRLVARALESKRRAARRASVGKYTKADVIATLQLQGGRCFYCLAPLHRGFDVDHMTPLSRGGSNGADNIVCACPACNRSKRARTAAEFILGGESCR